MATLALDLGSSAAGPLASLISCGTFGQSGCDKTAATKLDGQFYGAGAMVLYYLASGKYTAGEASAALAQLEDQAQQLEQQTPYFTFFGKSKNPDSIDGTFVLQALPQDAWGHYVFHLLYPGTGSGPLTTHDSLAGYYAVLAGMIGRISGQSGLSTALPTLPASIQPAPLSGMASFATLSTVSPALGTSLGAPGSSTSKVVIFAAVGLAALVAILWAVK